MEPRQRRKRVQRKAVQYHDTDESGDISNDVTEKKLDDNGDSDWGSDKRGGDSSSEALAASDEEEDDKPQKKKRKQTAKAPTRQNQNVASKLATVKKEPRPNKPRIRIKKKVYNSDSEEDNEEILGTSLERLTDRGGYAHTTKSRSRISRANRGNTPWNKGKQRSEADKARIRAGVKARNRAVLLQNLEKIGMDEAEYLKKKRQIKILRETVRRRKADLKKEEERVTAIKKMRQRQDHLGETAHTDESDETSSSDDSDDGFVGGEMASDKKVFTRNVEWSAHHYDIQEHVYQQICPLGGPGGLICCDSCGSAYSLYMTETAKEMESKVTTNTAKEIQEITDFMKDTQSELNQAVQTARLKPPPAVRMLPPSEAAMYGDVIQEEAADNSFGEETPIRSTGDYLKWNSTPVDLVELGIKQADVL